MSLNEGNVLEVLSLLEAYEKVHVEGNDSWKKALWNIYKGRHTRKRNSLGYVSETYCAASDVREDFDARFTLHVSNDKGTFVRVEDGVEVPDEKNDGDDILAIATSASSTGMDDTIPSLISEQEEGLRKRHSKPGSNFSSNSVDKKWTVEQTNDTEKSELVDPLEMMAGACPPRELKEAQQRAKEAIICYIEAANILVRLQQNLQIM